MPPCGSHASSGSRPRGPAFAAPLLPCACFSWRDPAPRPPDPSFTKLRSRVHCSRAGSEGATPAGTETPVTGAHTDHTPAVPGLRRPVSRQQQGDRVLAVRRAGGRHHAPAPGHAEFHMHRVSWVTDVQCLLWVTLPSRSHSAAAGGTSSLPSTHAGPCAPSSAEVVADACLPRRAEAVEALSL